MSTFEAAIYNEQVKAATARGEQHPRIAADWANVRFIEVEAINEAMARAKLNREYPSSEGFVIEEIMPA